MTAAAHTWKYFEAGMDVTEEMGCLVKLVFRDLQEREEILEDLRDQED